MWVKDVGKRFKKAHTHFRMIRMGLCIKNSLYIVSQFFFWGGVFFLRIGVWNMDKEFFNWFENVSRKSGHSVRDVCGFFCNLIEHTHCGHIRGKNIDIAKY